MSKAAKTYKREVAGGLLLFNLALGFWGIWEPTALTFADMLMPYVFSFASGAWLVDAVQRQVMPKYRELTPAEKLGYE